MGCESVKVELGGDEARGLYDDLSRLEVELSDDLPATFRLEIAVPAEPDGTWRHLDEESLRVWSEVTIEGGSEHSGREELIRGYVTEVRATFDPDAARCRLAISGTDASVLMDRDEKLKAWPGIKDSDIASEILGSYALTPVVEPTAVIHDAPRSTIIQRETDFHFLQRLALRNGFACYVEGKSAFFRPLPADPVPQPVLAAHFGEETTLKSFNVSIDALRPANVAMFQMDRFDKQVLSAAIEASDLEPMGEIGAAALLSGGLEIGRVNVARNTTTGLPEMEALCQSLFNEGDWFVAAAGEIDCAAYDHVLKPRGTVTVKGVGETYSGVYYVSYVRHSFTREGHSQHFRARRNALRPTGAESFSATSASGLL